MSFHAPVRLFLLGAAALLAACQGSSPVTPGTFGPPSGNNTGSVTGTVVDHDTQAPIPGATVLLAGVVASTDASGRFTLTGVPEAGVGAVTVNTPGYLFRGVAAPLGGATPDLAIDVVRDAPPFSLPFYREFARNSVESSVLLPTARWTRAPSFYLKTTVETSGDVVPPEVIAKIRDVIARSVVELSGGRYEMAAFETGAETREPADGWVTITFYPELSGGAFGRSSVGGNSGIIELRYGMVSTQFTNPGNCLSPEVSLVDHEIVHTMGFWHTRDVFADSFSGPGCPGAGRPAHVLYHAALMYPRPVGNRDPDVDPVEGAPVAAVSAGARPRMLVECRFGR